MNRAPAAQIPAGSASARAPRRGTRSGGAAFRVAPGPAPPGSGRQFLAAAGTARIDDLAAAGSGHSGPEAVPALADELARLIGPFHRQSRGIWAAGPWPAVRHGLLDEGLPSVKLCGGRSARQISRPGRPPPFGPFRRNSRFCERPAPNRQMPPGRASVTPRLLKISESGRNPRPSERQIRIWPDQDLA